MPSKKRKMPSNNETLRLDFSPPRYFVFLTSNNLPSLASLSSLTEKGYPSSNIQMENRFPQITNSSRTADSCGS